MTDKNTSKMYSQHVGSIKSPETLFERNGGLPRGKFRGNLRRSATADFRGF